MPLRDRRTALLLALLAFLIYNANFRRIGAGDSYPARFLPFALWNHGTLYLDPIREVTAQRHPAPYWIRPTPDGRSASLYPVVTPLLAAPLYLPPALWLRWTGETYERMSWLGEILEKLAASAIAAAAAGWMFLLLRRRLEPRESRQRADPGRGTAGSRALRPAAQGAEPALGLRETADGEWRMVAPVRILAVRSRCPGDRRYRRGESRGRPHPSLP
jgi:hypothetical protein